MVKGRWSQEEQERYKYARSRWGRSWKKISRHVQTRSPSQCRSHGQKADGLFLDRETVAVQTVGSDPRCFVITDPTESYDDDVDIFFDFDDDDTSNVFTATPIEVGSTTTGSVASEVGESPVYNFPIVDDDLGWLIPSDIEDLIAEEA